MDPILAGATGAEPAAFAVPDQNNAVAGAWVEQDFIVTGMGMGQAQSFTASGGQVARGRMGNPAFGASVTAMNGDLIRWRVQAPAQVGAAAVSTLSAGNRTASVTVRSALIDGVRFASSADVRTIQRAASADPFHFAAVGFPAGRPVVALDMTYYLASSVSVDGVALEQMLPADNNDDARTMVWVAPAGTDLAAGPRDVVVTTAYNINCVLFPAAVRGSGAATAALRPQRTRYGNKMIGDHATPLLAVPSGALAVGFASSESGRAISFPDALVERTCDTTIATHWDGVSATTARWITTGRTHAPTLAVDAVTYAGMLTMVFAP